MTINFEVKNRFSGNVQFTASINCGEEADLGLKLRLAVEWAISKKEDLRGANLRGADLRGADLSDADLRMANLSGASLSEANLRGADLNWANLSKADLRGTNLSDADLRMADLRMADLRMANLSFTSLRDADLSEEQLRNYKHDFWGILIRYKHEIPALRDHIINGKINGSVYSGECSCLMGTIANIKHCDVEEMTKDSSSYIESWFMMIRPGDKPENSFASKKALEWLDEFVRLSN